MKSSRFLPSVFRSVQTLAVFANIAVALCSGCVTHRQVQTIVAESNAALMASLLPDMELGADPKSSNPPPDPVAISKKIDDYIQAHPDQKVANSALRVRQAILLIAYEKYELARSAFADATELKTDRDKALKNSSESIIWWWQNGRVDKWLAPSRSKAREKMAALDDEIVKVQASIEIRDYLTEIRARMAFQLSKNLQASEGKKDVFVDAVNHYGATLTTNDVAAIRDKKIAPKSTAISPEEKRRLRADGVINKAKEAAADIRAGGESVVKGNFTPAAQEFGELVLVQ